MSEKKSVKKSTKKKTKKDLVDPILNADLSSDELVEKLSKELEETNATLEKERKRSRNKFGNSRVTVNGIKYDSESEYLRHLELLELESLGLISDLRYHNKKDNVLVLKDPKISYAPDFCYYDKLNDYDVIEDVKGMQTDVFVIKKKMLLSMIRSGIIDKHLILTKRFTRKSGDVFKIIEMHSSEESLKIKKGCKKNSLVKMRI